MENQQQNPICGIQIVIPSSSLTTSNAANSSDAPTVTVISSSSSHVESPTDDSSSSNSLLDAFQDFEPVRIQPLSNPQALYQSHKRRRLLGGRTSEPGSDIEILDSDLRSVTPPVFSHPPPAPSTERGSESENESESDRESTSSSHGERNSYQQQQLRQQVPQPSSNATIQSTLGSWGAHAPRPMPTQLSRTAQQLRARRQNYPPGGDGKMKKGRAPRTNRFISAGEYDDADEYVGRMPDQYLREWEEDDEREFAERAAGTYEDSDECPICFEEQCRSEGSDRLSSQHRAIAALELDTSGEVHPTVTCQLMLRARQKLIERPLEEELRNEPESGSPSASPDPGDGLSRLQFGASASPASSSSLSRRPLRHNPHYKKWSITLLKKHYGFGKHPGCDINRRRTLAKRVRFLKCVLNELETEHVLKEARDGSWRVIDTDALKAYLMLMGAEEKLGKTFEECRAKERLRRGIDTQDTAAGRMAAAAGWLRKTPLLNAATALSGPNLHSPFKFSGDI
jgi:hypothetical protein